MDQLQWRPIQYQAVDGNIWPFGVGYLDPANPQRIRKTPGQILQPNHAAGQACGLLLDQAAARVDIGRDRAHGDSQDRYGQNDQDDCRDPFDQAAGQNACPIPIYSSSVSPPGSLFSGTATSTRIGPMGV